MPKAIGRLIYLREKIRAAPDRWRQTYATWSDDRAFPWDTQRTAGDVRRELAKLDLETCTAADINAAIGAPAKWAENECDQCGRDCEALLHLGQEEDYDARFWFMCLDCLREAHDFLAAASRTLIQPSQPTDGDGR